MSESSREIAFDALLAVESEDAYLNLVLPKLIARANLSPSDSGFATELAYGTARWQGFYDWIIRRVTGRELGQIEIDVLVVIRIGAHQLLELATPPHAAIFETVNLAKSKLRKSVVGFINAALRRISEKSLADWLTILSKSDCSEDEYLSIKYSHPIWVTRSIKQALQAEGSVTDLELALSSDNVAPKVNLVALPGKGFSGEPKVHREGVSPIGYVLDGGDPSLLSGVKTGALRVQDQGSQLAALALKLAKSVKPQESWLDLCAGPGGKAVLLAALAKEEGAELSTNEVSKHRAKLVETALRHSGFTAKQYQVDGRHLPNKQMFDRILLDAPCTGLGALRRRPESRWRKNSDDLKVLASLQRELIVSAWKHLNPGGVLTYVTCSPHPTETTAQIEWLLRTEKGSVLLNATEVLTAIAPTLNLPQNRRTVQLWPHRDNTDAMFIALIQKPEK